MMPFSLEFRVLVSGLLLLTAFALGWLESSRSHEPVMTPITLHAQRRQVDGSIIAARIAPSVPHQSLPVGDVASATASVDLAATIPVLQPSSRILPEGIANSGLASGLSVSAATVSECQRILQCPAVHIDETLVKTPDGQQDLLVSTPEGNIAEARFSPLPMLVARPERYGVGVSYGPAGGGIIAFRQFTELPITVGVAAGAGKNTVNGFVVWRW